MNTLNSNHINILDLPPDEILRINFKKLNTVDIFYLLVRANQWFDRLALDLVIKRSNIHNSSIDVHILDKTLPRINEKVTKLTVDPLSMKRIFGAVHYRQLHSLSVINYRPEILLQYLSVTIMNMI